MLKNYDPNMQGKYIHTVRITIQQWGYVGHIIKKIRGNCMGRSMLDFDFGLESDFDNDFTKNDCKLTYDEHNDWYTAELENANNDVLIVDGDDNDMNNMIVAIEMIEVEVE